MLRPFRACRWFSIASLVALLLTASGAPIGPGGVAADDERYITLASTTSTENSGLFAHLLPVFTAKTGIAVRVIAQGTGKAIRTATHGDADVLLVHHPASEKRFVEEGFGVERLPVMYNDFVLVGPKDDPAQMAGSDDIPSALGRIASSEAVFVSRGDDSGTHKAELALWQSSGIDVEAASGAWYREAGAGMGAVLNLAAGLGAYTLSDRATWLAFQNQRDLTLLFEGDEYLFNQYSVILVSPEKHPHVKVDDGQKFVDWLIAEGQQQINQFMVQDQQVFFANFGESS